MKVGQSGNKLCEVLLEHLAETLAAGLCCSSSMFESLIIKVDIGYDPFPHEGAKKS